MQVNTLKDLSHCNSYYIPTHYSLHYAPVRINFNEIAFAGAPSGAYLF